MNPFPLIAASTACTDLLGTAPVRFYSFGRAPEGAALPYATWQTVTGTPLHNLTDAPAIDRITLQVDVWSATPDTARATLQAIRAAVETTGIVTALLGDDIENDTYRTTLQVQFLTTP